MKKIKFTWGHGMVLALLSFMIFIVSFLFRFNSEKGNSMDLVTEDYYNEGLKYQSKYDAMQNFAQLQSKPSIKVVGNELHITFPDSLKVLEGTLGIYRPSNKELDKNFELQLQDHQMKLNDKAFPQKGKYDIFLQWEDENNIPYLHKEEIYWGR